MENNLRALRAASGFSTQTALAEASGVTQATISNLESGKYAGSVSTLEKLARAMGRDLTAVIEAARRKEEPVTPSV